MKHKIRCIKCKRFITELESKKDYYYSQCSRCLPFYYYLGLMFHHSKPIKTTTFNLDVEPIITMEEFLNKAKRLGIELQVNIKEEVVPHVGS